MHTVPECDTAVSRLFDIGYASQLLTLIDFSSFGMVPSSVSTIVILYNRERILIAVEDKEKSF